MARPPSAAARRNQLESTLNANARALGTTVTRYRDTFNRTMLLMTLHQAKRQGLLDNYHLKGGAAIEVRHGFAARATRDIDIEIGVPLEELTTAFGNALAFGVGDFTFSLRPGERPVRNDAITVSVTMRYLDRPWATISVDLAPAQAGLVADDLPLIAVEFPDIIGEVRTMKTEFQIAQKIHAITTPDPPGHELPYARHVVDVLYLARNIDPAVVAAACQAVFDARAGNGGRLWPPEAVVLPERWIADYQAALDGYAMELNARDVPQAFLTLLTTIVGGVLPVPGYEYQFVSLAARPVAQNPQDETMETQGFQYQHFAALAANGWRVRSIIHHPRSVSSHVLVTLERELPTS